MLIVIDPRVDFAFKIMLGSPRYERVTVHFLNSILKAVVPIVKVRILNPLVGKDRSEDKIIVLDIIAQDQLGRIFNIEMQTRIPLTFANRILFYNSKNYTRQIKPGEGYDKLCPAISICLVDRCMFDWSGDTPHWHHSFRLRCDQLPEKVSDERFRISHYRASQVQAEQR